MIKKTEFEMIELLLNINYLETQFYHRFYEDCEVELHCNVADLILTLLGVPEDNTIETNACSRANMSGEWPDECFCRDGWYELINEKDAKKVISKVKRQVRILKRDPNWKLWTK